MATYIAMLRGVNVGGKSMLMAELRKLCTSLKLKNAQTYIQSGNVVLDYGGTSERLAGLLEGGIRKRFGMDVKVIVRTSGDLEKAIKSNPFGEGAYVSFLAEKPKRLPLEEMESAKSKGEKFSLLGREVYLSMPEGYGRTKLNNNFLESRLGVSATTRNMRTITALLEMAVDQT